MAGSCKGRYLAILIWAAGSVLLGGIFFGDQPAARALDPGEMRLVTGAIPAPDCFWGLVSFPCADQQMNCAGKNQAACLNTISCTGCSDQSNSYTQCVVAKPWIALCTRVPKVPGGCGDYYSAPACDWKNNKCICDAASTAQACDQYKDQAVTGSCTIVP
jgi:hypothetical protein